MESNERKIIADSLPKIIAYFKEAMYKVEKEYYYIRREKANPATRERTYCYELYHQLRCKDNESDYILHAELDKDGDETFDGEIPDFVVHKAGTGDNLLAVEVKVNDNQGLMINDIEKLAYMIEKHRYQYGLFILIGRDLEWVKRNRQKAINYYDKTNENEFRQKIYIACQKMPKESSVEIASIEQLQKEVK